MERKGYQNSPVVTTRVLLSLLLLTAISIPGPAPGQAKSKPDALTPAKLAAQADVVALVQARDTDYLYRRGFPYRGSAFLKVLIPYKGEHLPDIVEVYEEGLHEFECYFPNPTIYEEGRRYLVFLNRDPDKPHRYQGMKHGCAIEVLVRKDNRYAIRMPIEGIAVSGDFQAHSRIMEFADAHAFEDEESISPARRDELISAGFMERVGKRFRYTRGIDLSDFRRSMQAGLR